MTTQPLRGLRIVVTRAAQDAPTLLANLERLGAHAIHAPALSFAPPQDPQRFADAVRRISSYDWAVFTSVQGVQAVFPAAIKACPVPEKPHFAAIGPATRDALLSRGVPVAFMPKTYRTDELAQSLPDVQRCRVVLLRAEVGNPDLVRILRARGATVDDVPAYRTVPDPEAGRASAQIASAPPDWVLFSSPSAVEHFSALWGPAELAKLQGRARAACIGPVTGRAALHHGWAAPVVAASHTIPGLVQALLLEVGPNA